jgi:hypothetical protein
MTKGLLVFARARARFYCDHPDPDWDHTMTEQ